LSIFVLLITNGIVKAGTDLVEKLKGEVVTFQFLIILNGFVGEEKLKYYKINLLLNY